VAGVIGRAGRIFLIVFQVVFLNVIVPGHTRGIITLSGRSSVVGLEDLGGGGCCRKGEGPAKSPTDKDRAECAICFLAARITPPAVVDLRLTSLGLLEVMPPVAPAAVITPDLPLTYHGRAPPAA
jgi:hypothetical protein